MQIQKVTTAEAQEMAQQQKLSRMTGRAPDGVNESLGSQSGQSLVELVLVLPIIVWLVVGVSFLFEVQHVKINLMAIARAAGREAAQTWIWNQDDVWRRTSREVAGQVGLDPDRLNVSTKFLGLHRATLSYSLETPGLLRVALPDEIVIRVKGANIP